MKEEVRRVDEGGGEESGWEGVKEGIPARQT